MEGDIHGVRIIPSVLQFFNTQPNALLELPITVKNVSKSSKSIRYYGPKSENFGLKVKNPEEPVAPGLAVSGVVHYQSFTEKEERDRIVLTVNGNVIEVPIYAHPSQCLLDFDNEVNFGTVVANSKVVAKEITITNTGSKNGDFKIKYDGNKPIAFIPSSGTIPPNSEQKVKVEYVTRLSGKFREEAEVYLEGKEMTHLHIQGFVTERALELLSVSGDSCHVQCIRFGNTYYGTDCTECAVLYNNGPEPVNFVAVVDEDAIAQELGIDLTQTTTSALAEEGSDKNKQGHTNDITSLITAIPNQGILKPYQKIPIFFRFSPRWHTSKQGWKSQACHPPRKDFALFMRLQIIGSSKGFVSDNEGKSADIFDKSNVEGAYAEVALTGTALPVLLNISPAAKFDFGECPVGEHADILCTIKNESHILPVLFEFRRIAHFTSHPPNGKIYPGQTQDVIFSFAPKQAGAFKPEQLLDVIGQLADKRNPTMAHAEIIYTLPIKLMGKSNPITMKPKPKFNKGITPYNKHEVGMYVESTFDTLSEDDLRNAVAGSTKTKLHRLKRGVKSADFDKNGKPIRVAFPNDRAQSIRPFDRSDNYQSLFTRSDRHNYIDPDYSLDDMEIERRKTHKDGYVQQLHKLREVGKMRKQKKEYLETNNSLDIGIKTAAGIFPRKLKQDEILPDPMSPLPPNADWKLLSTKELANSEKQSVSKAVCDGLNAVPTSPQEKRDCERWLSPQQLHQIVIGPPTIDFGQICLRSICQRELNIINNLNQIIHIVAEIDCRELRQSSPLSQVVPAQSKAVIPIIFESNTRGRFQRSVMYTVNGFYKHHVTVLAEVVPVSVDLSRERLVLKPGPGMPAEAGFRNVITLNNSLNYPAEFTWSPDLGEKGTAFSIRPATGVVEPGTDLDCEVVWHPSYMAPEDGSFTLLVNGGDSRKLTCRAELGTTNVYFLDPRISFGAAPVNLTTVTTAILHNAGNNHAYFQVLDPNPLPGLIISPIHGVVPVGGSTEIRAALTPDAIMKFDTRVQISIKGGKTIELRVGGTVEPPHVNIDVESFNFGGVYCGSTATVPFRLENKASTKCRLEIDLTRYKDFGIAFPGCQSQEDYNYQILNPGMSSVTLEPEEIIEGEITFTPTQVAAYDFVMPVAINSVGAPSPAPTPFPPTPAPSNKNSIQHIINPRPVPPTVTTPRKHIIATALRQPLQLGTNRLEFILPATFHDISTNVTMGTTKYNEQAILILNNSNEKLTWGLDLSLSDQVLDKGIFKFLHEQGVPFVTKGESRGIEGFLEPGMTQTIVVNFCPVTAGKYQVVIPVVINSNWDKPFQFLEIYGELKAPEIWFEPHTIVLTPVPLLTEVSAEFTILASHYRSNNKLTVTLPEIECDDTTTISPLSVSFTEGSEIKPCSGTEAQVDPFALPCKVTFSSPKPVSFSESITFTDEQGRSFTLQVTATADNCLLTCYPFLALHRGDHQIVCEQGSSPKGRKLPPKTKGSTASGGSGEAVFVPCTSPNYLNSRPSTSATSSNFQISSSSYESSNSITDSSASSSPGPRDGAMNKPPTGSDFIGHKAFENAARSAGSAIFPDEDSEEGMFHMEVLLAAQRWFSSQGWPGGPYPILIPETLRTAISKKTAAEPAKNKDNKDSTTKVKGNTKPSKGSFNKLAKTIYDMINYLSGRSIPGIPINSPLPADPVERVKQIYWQHCTLLTFLRCQGACVSAIQPEYLMAPGDFVLWRQLQRSVKMELLQQGLTKEADKVRIDEDVEEEVFEAISKRMWTDTALQILKVLILAKVTPKTLKALNSIDKEITMPNINVDPLSSNIYSLAERILLAWMNHHYENYRREIWKDCPKGGVPPSRWIVNFDYDLMDGLVLASLLGAHMPFLIKSHLAGMYTHPTTAEQCLHNALKVVNAMRYAGIDYDIQAIDITDPNPIPLLLLSVHLYQRLPQYLPKATMEFTGSLHSTVTRQVKVTNSSPKPLVYNVFIAGHDARDFNVPKGSMVTVPPKSTLPLSVEFTSRFLRPANAVLVLVGKRQGAATGNTLTFNLVTDIDNIRPKKKGVEQCNVKVESPCYELERVMLDVTNPFTEGGEFRIILIESKSKSNDSLSNSTSLIKTKEKRTSKSKKVKSKIDHGKKRVDTPPEPIPMNRLLEQQEANNQNSQIPYLQAFHCPMKSVRLDSFGHAEVEVDFLPFSVEERQCSVIFLNENIGEFLYSIEAKALYPLPSYLPYMPSKSSVRISSAAAAGSGRGMYGGDDNIIYWKCESGQLLKETLLIPVTNMVKERALIIAAQQKMTDKEVQRRQVTGTMMSCSVTSKTIKTLSNNPEAAVTIAKSYGPVNDVYRLEVDTDHFKIPDMLVMPSPLDAKGKCLPQGAKVPKDVNLADGVVELPISFKAKDPGHYPTTITMRSIDDIRVYRIECTVNPEGSTAELEFNAPVHQSVTQNIPVMNVTNNDWPLKATITGDGFSGPATLLAKAFMTTNYPLVFKPLREEDIAGRLILTNKDDGTDHIFHLTGKGQKPLALDQIKLECGAKSSLIHSVKVPNVTKKKLTYRVESDLSFVTGQQSITVLAKQTGSYNIVVTPTRRGKFKGVVAFIAGENPIKEIDSDGEELLNDDNGKEYHGYRMWYALEVNVRPPVPERTMHVVCACQKKTMLEVIVRNPTLKDITLNATVTGRDLSGPPSICLMPGEKDVYSLTYAPAQVGKTRGSLIFFSEEVGEFWYDLVLQAESPPPTTLPHMECELGRWTKQAIMLKNPTDETLELIPTISNTNNFSLERDNERPIILRPQSIVEVPLKFMPSSLGEADHLAKIIFLSEQLGEWIFVASGTGLLPRPKDPVCVYTAARSNTTLIIPFRNPTDIPILADVILTDAEALVGNHTAPGPPEVPFKLLLKHDTGIRVGPKSTLEIPISFAPSEMVNYQACCTVVVKPEDGQQWPYVPQDALGHKLSVTATGLNEIRWLFPIKGVPESSPMKDNQAATITCQARDMVEQRLEVTLAGVAPGSSGVSSLATRAKTPKDKKPQIPDGVVVGNTMATAEEFSFELSYNSDESQDVIERSLNMNIMRHYRDPASGLVTLLLNVRFTPCKTMDHPVHLLVKAATGGLWKFPLRFTATEPPVDDTVFIEASGLGKQSSVGFRLNSQQKHPAVFNAFFESGSDPEFSVTPQTGELLPGGTPGTLFSVSFLPNVYGKLYHAKLIIQTPDMQWSYSLKGVLPEYKPPRGVSAHPIAGPHPVIKYASHQTNHIRENLKLTATAVSSPIKGAPLFPAARVK